MTELRMLAARGQDAETDLFHRRPFDIALSIVSRQAGYVGIATCIVAIVLVSRYVVG